MSKRTWLSFIGPGLLYAGAAIGVSHLVQSTRAGALYGFQLFGIVILLNILKFPFFEAGSRYAGATGKSLIHAYGKLNKKILWFYMIQSFITMFIIQMALTIVTVGILKTLLRIEVDNWIVGSLLCCCLFMILFVGRYSLLKNLTKWIVISLTICTFIAVLFALNHPDQSIQNETIFSWKNSIDIAFLVALAGWMPAPLDISVWQSVWRVDGNEDTNLKQSLIDFHVGYWGTTLVSLLFLCLGAFIFFHSGKELATGSSAFSAQLVEMYTTAIGSWSWPIVTFAAFATMFTTCLTCLDANPRVINRSLQEIGVPTNKWMYFLLVILASIGAVVIPIISQKNMTDLVDFATTVSFLTAPIFATLNLLVYGQIEKRKRPNLFTKTVAIIGLIFLYGFAFYYLYSKFS